MVLFCGLTFAGVAQAQTACPPGVQCGTVPVPLDRANPAAGTIDIAYALVPRTDTSRPSLGTIVPNPGGPGESTSGFAGLYVTAFAPLRARRDLLLIDARGTGQSGALSCPSLAARDPLTLDRADARDALRRDLGRARRPLRHGRRRRRHRGRAGGVGGRQARPVGRLLRHVPDAGVRGSPPGSRPLDRARRRVPDRLGSVGPRRAARRRGASSASSAGARTAARARACCASSGGWPAPAPPPGALPRAQPARAGDADAR